MQPILARPSRLCLLTVLFFTVLFFTVLVAGARPFPARAAQALAAPPAPPAPTAAGGVTTVAGVTVAWQARHGLSGDQFQAAFDDLGSQGYRLTQVTGYAYGDTALYAAIWEQRDGPPMQARHGLTNAQYQQFVNDMIAANYRPLWVSGYTIANVDHYATIWEQSSGPDWIARHGLSNADYQAAFTLYADQGYRLVQVSGYAINNQDYYAAIWEKRDGPPWVARHGLNSADYQAAFNDYAGQGYRLRLVHGYTVNNEPRFAAIWEQIGGPGWEARHNLTNADYQATFNDLATRGYMLKTVSGYTVNGQDYYAALWESTVQPFTSLPMTGDAVPELAVFDQTMQDFMVARQIPAGTLTVMKDGVIVLARGYGWLDRDQTQLLPPDALLRLASIIKPVTEAAIRKLIAAGQLQADDRVFCLPGSPANCILNLTPAGTADANAVNITIQHLLDHEGGWDRDASFDPMFRVIDIANDLGVTSPPSQTDIARYMLGRPLDFVPGSKSVYSNFGYLLLGLVIQEVTGQSYTSYIQSAIFTPLCVPKSEIELGRSLPGQRNPREPWYADPNTAKNVFDPTQTVLFPDGGFYIEAMEAHGGMIASGSALAKFLQAYWIGDGQPRTGNGQDWTFFGSLPGTHTLVRQRTDGVNIVALFNQRTDPSGLNYEAIKDLLDSAANAVTTWPSASSSAAGLAQSAALAEVGERALCFFPSTTGVIGAAGGILGSFDGTASLNFPAGAVGEPVSVRITPALLTPGPGFTDLDLYFVLEAFNQFAQPITTFGQPVTIDVKLPAGLSEEELERTRLYYEDAQDARRWIMEGIQTILRTLELLRSSTTHFSTFAVLTEGEPNPPPNAPIYLPLLRR